MIKLLRLSLCVFSVVCTLLFQQALAQQGFASVTRLNSLPIAYSTKEKAQAKVWKHAGYWWSVLADSTGTQIFRLEGASWTPVLNLVNTDAKADHWMVNNVVHILLYKGGNNNSFLYSIEYDSSSKTYKLWNKRPERVRLVFPSGSEFATLTVDGKGRMWVAYGGVGEVNVRWSDAPYTTWSAPVNLAKGIKDDDVCAITKLPGRIGVLWSNQKTGLFGFKTHLDNRAPTDWSADEVPASQSAINGLPRMADDHMNFKVASDGTLYCAVKTSYTSNDYPLLALLVRRPGGKWDNLYQVTSHEAGGTQPVVILNETMGRIKIVYTTVVNGGDIVYRESSTSKIAFGDARVLISGGGHLYNYATTTHQAYDKDVVILATNLSTIPYQAMGVLAMDSEFEQRGNRPSLLNFFAAFPNPFTSTTTLSFNPAQEGAFTLALHDSKGVKVSVLKQGVAKMGEVYTINVDETALQRGIYYAVLQMGKEVQSLKILFIK